MHRYRVGVCLGAALAVAAAPLCAAGPKKPHVVGLGAARTVPYSKAGDPAGALPDESALKTRPLVVDGRVTEWTTGEAHDVTDRSFVVRRALRINDALPAGSDADAKPNDARPNDAQPNDAKPSDAKPSDAKPGVEKTARAEPVHWVWQKGPWLLVDRVTGHVAALKLPDYNPGVSQVVWFRDYAAYCGVTASGKSLYAVVAQLGARKPVLAKKLEAFEAGDHAAPVCGAPEWQREPLRVTFHPAGRDAAGFDLVGGSAVLVEGEDDTAGTRE